MCGCVCTVGVCVLQLVKPVRHFHFISFGGMPGWLYGFQGAGYGSVMCVFIH